MGFSKGKIKLTWISKGSLDCVKIKIQRCAWQERVKFCLGQLMSASWSKTDLGVWGTCSEHSTGEVVPPLSACALLLLLNDRILKKFCFGGDFDLLWGCPCGDK